MSIASSNELEIKKLHQMCHTISYNKEQIVEHSMHLWFAHSQLDSLHNGNYSLIGLVIGMQVKLHYSTYFAILLDYYDN